ncbi:MAG: hypothetical protein PHX20_05160 [Candidatus Omnitrophica bacterium]|nr:hypothetical protein [Candidatus Omnitrophota bacterium]MDD5436913.1 hypothetical protein [Candidatus Omnitrophota bacterium]
MRNHVITIIAAVIFFSSCATGLSFCRDIVIGQLVDEYSGDTDIQKEAMVNKYLGSKIAVDGMVKDVKDEKTFDVVNDVERNYYKVITDVASTAAGNPYRTILIYKDKARVSGLNVGQKISLSGDIIRVVDEGLYLSVWISADPLTDHERELFK